MSTPLLEIKNVCLSHSNKLLQRDKDFSLQDISFQLQANSSISLLGESATGKSSLIMALMKLHPIDSGQILYKGRDIATFTKKELRKYQKNIQPVFQNFDEALNPYIKISKSLFPGFPTNMHQAERDDFVHRLLELMDLNIEILGKYPHQLSGGEKQRISLLRALVSKPEIIILDEPFSALDIINQEKLLQLLMKIKEELQVAYLLITHKIPLTKYFADKLYLIQKSGIHSFDNYAELVANYE